MYRRLAALSVLLFTFGLVAVSGVATGDEPKGKATTKSTTKMSGKMKKGDR